MANRYDQLLSLIDKHKPKSIAEVGVHRAARSRLMCARALRHQNKVLYTGFDVFEHMGQKFQDEALNGKGMAMEAEARRVMDAEAAKWAGRIDYRFVIGDTRKTLHPYPCVADFAFIDGDHRIEAIHGDYLALKDCQVVVFDDYYCPDERSLTVDLKLYGANATVNMLRGSGANVEILPVADPCKHGGVIRLAVVTC